MGKGAKFYAVKAGRVPGVYTAWADAEKHVKGFGGAAYKSFGDRASAEAWIADVPSVPTALAVPRAVEKRAARRTVFTDGSHIKGETLKRGIGAYCKHGGRVYRLARNMAALDERASNPTLELLAAIAVLRAVPADAAPSEIEIAADYIGVVNYVNGTWTPKSRDDPFAEHARELVGLLATLRARGFTVAATHVRGHTGVDGNEEADTLAKLAGAGEECDEFDGLFDSE